MSDKQPHDAEELQGKKKQQSPNIGENKSVEQNMLRKKSGKRKGEAMVS